MDGGAVGKELVMLFFVVDSVDFAWVVGHFRLDLPRWSTIFPGLLPELVDDVHVFCGCFVSLC